MERRVASAVVIGICAAALVRSPQFEAYRAVRSDEGVYRDALKLRALERPSTVPVLMVQMTGAANYYTPGLRFLRYDALSPAAWQALRTWQAAANVPIDAALLPFERDEIFGGVRTRTPLPCGWRSRGYYRHVTFWECPP